MHLFLDDKNSPAKLKTNLLTGPKPGSSVSTLKKSSIPSLLGKNLSKSTTLFAAYDQAQSKVKEIFSYCHLSLYEYILLPMYCYYMSADIYLTPLLLNKFFEINIFLKTKKSESKFSATCEHKDLHHLFIAIIKSIAYLVLNERNSNK